MLFKPNHSKNIWLSCLLLGTATYSVSAQETFTKGPVIKDFGQNAAVEITSPLNKTADFHVSFDVAKAASPGKHSRGFNTPARFLNMMVRHGVPQKNIKLAVVVHGGATVDVTNDAFYKTKKQSLNGNKKLIKALIDNGIRVIVCGQSSAANGIQNKDLLPGVEMALSAITAHASLKQEGYTVNPF